MPRVNDRRAKDPCRFGTKQGCPRDAYVDYKDIDTLKKMVNEKGKFSGSRPSGNCAAFQSAM